ncbi:MAG: hypothetical protein ABIF06_00415 [bacterium]
MTDGEKGKVDQLSDQLYSRTSYHDPVDKRRALKSDESSTVGEGWQGPNLDEMLGNEFEQPETHPVIKKIFTFSLIFFILAVLVAGYIFFGGVNFISSKNVDITIVGPTSVSAGEPLDLGVTVSNKNNADLELANLTIQYPPGTREVADTTKSLSYVKDELGEIGAGKEVARNVQAVLFGPQGEVKEIKFSAEYKVKGSNATFYKDKIYEVTIGEAPLAFAIESPRTVDSGESFSTTIHVSLNSADVLKNVVVRGEYPYGYSVISTTPEALSNGNAWSLGDLTPGEKKTIVVKGQIIGENQEERTFRFYVGVADGGDSPNFKTIIYSSQNTITIARPSVGLNISLNGEKTPTYVAPADQSINASVSFQNNLSDKLINPRLEVELTGQALDKLSVIAQGGGFYDSHSNKLVWNLQNSAGLAELAPGDNGQVSFRFTSLGSLSNVSGGRDIYLVVTLYGTPINTPGGGPISVSEKRTVKISSEVSLSTEVLHSRGSFANRGPIPPKADEETTYTVVWTLGNTQADMKNAYMTASLGPKVTYLSGSEFSSESLTYTEESNTITWEVGNLASGAGFSAPARTVSFQVALTPSISQIGTVPVLVNSIIFFGIDQETGGVSNLNKPALTTRLSNDPQFVQGDEYVVK